MISRGNYTATNLLLARKPNDRLSVDDVDGGTIAVRSGGAERPSARRWVRIGTLFDEPDPLAPGWPAWDLEMALWALPGIGRTKATKLIARKRPGCTRSSDSVVSGVLGTERAHLNPVLPEKISALWVFDVIAWMGGKCRGLSERSDLQR